MTDYAICSTLDIGCNLNNFLIWQYNIIIAPYFEPTLGVLDSALNLLFSVFGLFINLILSIFYLGSSILNNIFGFLYDIATIDSSFTVIVSLLYSYVSIIIFIRVWNIISGLEIAGFKLPKIQM
jgi:hypothetical protein